MPRLYLFADLNWTGNDPAKVPAFLWMAHPS